MADEKEDEVAEASSGPSLVKWAIAVGLTSFLGAFGAVVVGPMVVGSPPPPAAVEGEAAEPVVAALDPAIYVPLEPPLLASFEQADGSTRYLQMSLQAMGRTQSEMDEVRNHAPAIRNSFLFLMSNYSYDQVSTVEGKEALRQEMLAAAQDILVANTGAPSVEEIYFTSLVLQ